MRNEEDKAGGESNLRLETKRTLYEYILLSCLRSKYRAPTDFLQDSEILVQKYELFDQLNRTKEGKIRGL